MNSIVLIGMGAIGQYVVRSLKTSQTSRLEAVVCRDGREAHTASLVPSGTQIVTRIAELTDDLTDDTSCIIDCAGHTGLRAHGAAVLERGCPLATVSVGALADAELAGRLSNAARQGNSQLRLLSGAVGALDALGAAREGGLDSVVYQARKPPKGWVGSPAESELELHDLKEPACHFRGNAREAAIAYPKNANVAAAVALAGCGFEDTQVELIADPKIERNIHVIEARGAFGQLRFDISGCSLPDAPRSSALTAMSVMRYVHNQTAAIVMSI